MLTLLNWPEKYYRFRHDKSMTDDAIMMWVWNVGGRVLIGLWLQVLPSLPSSQVPLFRFSPPSPSSFAFATQATGSWESTWEVRETFSFTSCHSNASVMLSLIFFDITLYLHWLNQTSILVAALRVGNFN